MTEPPPHGVWEHVIGWVLDHAVIVFLLAAVTLAAGVYVSPFGTPWPSVPSDPVPVDAIPDVGDNQQIVSTTWPGRSPRDVEDQITYPLTTTLLGIPGVRTVRSTSAMGLSTVYVLFDDDVEFYWSRSRVLEKLSALAPGTVPADVTPTLGPDATALGQIFWYTLQGRDRDGVIVGGWDPDELRSIQDWTVRTALQSVGGVSEVASVGGFVREYQVDVDPDAMRAHDVDLSQVADAVRRSNLDVGARTLEINQVEYVVRGLGFIESVSDLEQTVVEAREHTPVRIRDVARVALGPSLRRGALDDAGAPAVGGVVVARYLENPRAVIDGVHQRIAEIGPGLPTRLLDDGTASQVTIVPFYDRTTLIDETLDTLSTSLLQQIWVTVLVVLVMLRSARGSLLIASVLPAGVLSTFVVMRLTGVDANIMALGGIAIAIGTLVDLAIVFVENIDRHLVGTTSWTERSTATRRATAEVAPAVLTSVLTTVVSFLPVLGLTASELRLFGPLAFTKTFAMGTALVLSMIVLPTVAVRVLRPRPEGPTDPPSGLRNSSLWALGAAAVVGLAAFWMPLGIGSHVVLNVLFVAVVLATVLGILRGFEGAYPTLLSWVLANRAAFLTAPAVVVVFALGFALPSLGREYMPRLDEGSFLYMPTTMPHASIGEVLEMLSTLDASIAQIPEVDRVVGKLGRVDSALDPAPVSMIETLITTVPEYGVDAEGERVRQWRDHIDSSADIWTEITAAAALPGLTSAPVLMPIEARLVMLQSGMRAPLGVKVQGPSLQAIETFGLALERVLRTVPSVRAETVFADRVVGKPYLEIDIDREAIGRHGLTVVDVQQVLQVALGGVALTQTVEGRERYPVRVRYMREDRDDLEALARVFVTTPSGEPIPLSQVADIRYARGPQVIRAEDTFLTSYVLFDRDPDVSELDVVAQAQAHIESALASGELVRPDGVSLRFAGTYENQVRSERRLMLLVPLALVLVFGLLYLQFKRVRTTAIVASGVVVAVSGGFVLLWLYGQPWFGDVGPLGSVREVFHIGPVHLSVAVWIGVIALIGIATDDGVIMATTLDQVFRRIPPTTVSEVRALTLVAGTRRIRPCLMTTATTTLALLPVVTSQGRGADVMVPLALPILGGMTFELMTLFVVPVLYCAAEERQLS